MVNGGFLVIGGIETLGNYTPPSPLPHPLRHACGVCQAPFLCGGFFI